MDKDTDECRLAQTRILLNSIGSKYFQLLTSLAAPTKPSEKTYVELINLLVEHLNPSPNVFLQQHKFLSRTQGPTETIAQFIASLRQLSIYCNFVCPHDNCKKPIQDVFLRSQFIRGLHDTVIREKFCKAASEKTIP